ncbi:MAG: hypothetical protein GXW99_07055 [Clostridiales bacterium]|nr:hypothetical protein [Clostridiales bacterium]
MIYNKVRKHGVACLGEQVCADFMVINLFAAADTSGNILTEVHCNG